MVDLLTTHLSEILSFIGGAIAGSFITLSITRHYRVKGRGTIVDQSSSRAGGDIIGRDKNS